MPLVSSKLTGMISYKCLVTSGPLKCFPKPTIVMNKERREYTGSLQESLPESYDNIIINAATNCHNIFLEIYHNTKVL